MLKTVVYRCQLEVRTFKKELHVNLGLEKSTIDLFNPRYHCRDFRSMKVDYDMSACDGEDLISH